MAVIGELLFYQRNGVTLDDVLRHRSDAQVREEVDKLPASEFSKRTDAELVQVVVDELRIAPLKIDFENGKPDVKEISFTAQDVFGERVNVKGLRATKAFDFAGDPELFKLQPNPYDLNPPRGKVEGKWLVVGIEVRDHDSESAVAYIKETVGRVTEYVKRQDVQLESFNTGLPGRVLPWVQRRRGSLGKASDLLSKL